MRELNLIPSHLKQKREQEAMLLRSVLGALLIVLLLAVIAFVPYSKLSRLNKQEITLKASLEKANTAIAENEKLKKETDSYKQYVDLVEKIQKSNTPVVPIFKALEKYMPQSVVISSLSYNAGSININASAKDYNAINEFEANLQESKEFADSLVTNINRDEKTGDNTFTLVITYAKGEVK